MKRKPLGTVFYLVFTFAVVAVFINYLSRNADKYNEILHISKINVLMLFTLSLAFPLLNGMQNTFLYRGLGLTEFSHLDGFLITAASTFVNQLPLPGGIISKGYFLKNQYGLSYTKFTGSTFALFFCFLTINGLIGIAVLLWGGGFNGIMGHSVLLIAYGMMAASILVFWLPLDRIRMHEKLRRWVRQTVDGWMMIGKDLRLLCKLSGLQMLLVLLLSFRYWIVFHMLSQNITLGQSLLFASASILTQLVSIVPGGLGVRESIVASVAAILGFDSSVSVVAVSLDRLIVTVVIVIVGWISIVVLGKKESRYPV